MPCHGGIAAVRFGDAFAPDVGRRRGAACLGVAGRARVAGKILPNYT